MGHAVQCPCHGIGHVGVVEMTASAQREDRRNTFETASASRVSPEFAIALH